MSDMHAGATLSIISVNLKKHCVGIVYVLKLLFCFLYHRYY